VISPASPHLVAVAALESGATVDLAFFSADLRDAAFAGVRDPPPSWGADELPGPNTNWRGGIIGFSPSGLFAHVLDRDVPDATVSIVRLTDDGVVARVPASKSAATLQRHGIVPGLFTSHYQRLGRVPFAVGDRAYRVERVGAEIVLSRLGPADAALGRKTLGRLAPEELDPAFDRELWLAVSAFEPRAAVLVPTPSGTRVFGARLGKGFEPVSRP